MDTRMLTSLIEHLDRARGADAGAVVITGSGGVFSAGADVNEQLEPEGARRRMRLFALLYEAVARFPKPTVAAITGHCIGGGAEVAAACDLRVGTTQASIVFPGARYGIPVGSARLPMLIGLSHAKDLLMTTRPVDGAEAFRLGFINRLADEQHLEDHAVGLAAEMASNPGAARQKQLLARVSELEEKLWSENRSLVRWQQEAPSLMGAFRTPGPEAPISEQSTDGKERDR